jgi:molybdopterin molybdotransferase
MAPDELVEIEDARAAVQEAAQPLEGEQVELGLAALGRVLAEDAVASEPVPAFENSAMDGFAVRAADLASASRTSRVSLQVVGESRAGHPCERTLAPGQAIAISTGAAVPAGADAVVRVEDTERDGERVAVLVAPSVGRDIRRAGEDVVPGRTVIRAGTPIGAAELGVLASLGLPRLRCARRARVSLLVSGDELLAPGEPMRPGGVRDTNSLAIAALATEAGAEILATARARDEAAATRAALAAALDGADVLVVCGGVSVGAHDHVKGALAELGARSLFWGLALKPGRPAWFGTAGGTLVFGLPGNPVSAMVTFTLLVAPALRAMHGVRDARRPATAVLDVDYEKAPGRAHALRCRLEEREDGWHARPTGAQGSHVLTSMLGADALAIVPTASSGVRAGERVPIERVGGLA